MAARNLPTLASYEVHETIRVDTSDNEDHTFCGIMFPIKAKDVLPVDKIVIHSIALRGQLGPMTVWVTNNDGSPGSRTHATIADDGSIEYSFRLSPRHWTKIYEAHHEPSQRTYAKLDLKDNPIVLRPGHSRAIYVHSSLPGDEAIVYDNSPPTPSRETIPARYKDPFISIQSGKAHLSPTPFGQLPIWGWGNAWRDHREFVGQVEYGAVYKLWRPELHLNFGQEFSQITKTLLLLQRKKDSPVSILPDECIFYILNLCRWDWFGDQKNDMFGRRRARRKKEKLIKGALPVKSVAAVVPEAPDADADAKKAAAPDAEAKEAAAPDAEAKKAAADAKKAEADAKADAKAKAEAEAKKALVVDKTGNLAVAEAAEESSEDDFVPDEPQQEDANWAYELVRNQVMQAEAERSQNGTNEEEDGNESDESEWERANGYRADNSAFAFKDDSEDDGYEGDREEEEKKESEEDSKPAAKEDDDKAKDGKRPAEETKPAASASTEEAKKKAKVENGANGHGVANGVATKS